MSNKAVTLMPATPVDKITDPWDALGHCYTLTNEKGRVVMSWATGMFLVQGQIVYDPSMVRIKFVFISRERIIPEQKEIPVAFPGEEGPSYIVVIPNNDAKWLEEIIRYGSQAIWIACQALYEVCINPQVEEA